MAVKRNVVVELTYTNSDRARYTSFLNQNEDLVVPIKRNVTVSNSYCKLISLYGNKEEVEYQMGVYTEDGATLIFKEGFTFVPSDNEDSVRWDKQAYWDYKIRYDDAIDILEEGQTA